MTPTVPAPAAALPSGPVAPTCPYTLLAVLPLAEVLAAMARDVIADLI